MAHFVRHHQSYLWECALLEKIVIECDPRRAEEPGDIRAHTRCLTRGIHLEDLFYRDLIRPRHCENGLADFGFRKRFIRIKERLDESRCDEDQDKRENNGYAGSPNPPRFRCSPKHSVQHDEEDRAADERDAKTNQLLPKPCRETLCGESVLMLAKEVLVDVERKAQNKNDQQIQHAVTGDLRRFMSR